MHRSAPFLFFNGNTFSAIGRQMASVLFADIPPARRREIISAVAHYIAGVLDWDAASAIIIGMSAMSTFTPGMKVKTMRGSAHGTVVRVLEDGRLVWVPDGGHIEMIAMPDSLLPDN